jgi:hypothetical protein
VSAKDFGRRKVMPNAKEIKTTKKNILIYGPTGSGKTTLFTTLPGKKFLYVFDPAAVDSIKGLDIEYEYFPPDGILGIRATQKGVKGKKKFAKPESFDKFEEHLENWLENDLEGFDTIGFSSITTLSQILMNKLLDINGRFGRVPELADYNLLGITLVALMEAVLSIPNKLVFVEGHSDLVNDEVSKMIVNQWDVTKNCRRMLPRLFSDVWVSEADPSAEKVNYRIQTSPDKKWPQAKNSFSRKFKEDITINLKQPREEQGVGRWF